jgi:DNA-binding NarL/FixJ family response regulator
MTEPVSSRVLGGEDADTSTPLRIRVAIVDDHSMVAEGLSRIISGEPDFELAGIAGDVAEALALIERETPDVVLMDYLLPDGDGADATEVVRRRWPQTKVIMLSGSDARGILARAIGAGCSGFLAKNRPASDVTAAVRTASRGESVMRSDELAELISELKDKPGPQSQWLTPRELEVLHLLAKGNSTEMIASDLFVSVNTVRNHVSNTLTKLGAHSKLEAVAFGLRDGIIRIEDINT